MFMVAGGHFAGAVVRVSKSDEELEEERAAATTDGGQETEAGKRKKKAKPKKPKPETEVVLHKTFHRYTSACVYYGRKAQGSLYTRSASEAGRFTVCQRQFEAQGEERWCAASSIRRAGAA